MLRRKPGKRTFLRPPLHMAGRNITRIAVGMQHAGEGGQMLPGMQSLAIRTEEVADCGWCRVTMGTAVANIGPQSASPGLALAWLQHRNGRVVTMKSMASEHMVPKLHQQRLQQCAGLTDPVRHGRAGKVDAFPRVNLGLAIERQVIAVFGDQHMGEETWPGLSAQTCVSQPLQVKRGWR